MPAKVSSSQPNSSLRRTIRFLIQESLENIPVFLRSLFWLLLVADGIPVVLLSDRDDSPRFAPLIIEKKAIVGTSHRSFFSHRAS